MAWREGCGSAMVARHRGLGAAAQGVPVCASGDLISILREDPRCLAPNVLALVCIYTTLDRGEWMEYSFVSNGVGWLAVAGHALF